MKRCIIGIAFMGLGMFGFINMHRIAISALPLAMYYTKYGEYGQALINNYSLIPMILSVVLTLVGFIILCKEYIETLKKREESQENI